MRTGSTDRRVRRRRRPRDAACGIVSSRSPQCAHSPGQVASHNGWSGRAVRIFCRKTSSRSISWCSSMRGWSSSPGMSTGTPVRKSTLGKNSSSIAPRTWVWTSFRQRAHSSVTGATCSLWTRMPSLVRVRRAWPRTAPRSGTSWATAAMESAKSNSPGRARRLLQKLGNVDRDHGHKKRRASAAGWIVA